MEQNEGIRLMHLQNKKMRNQNSNSQNRRRIFNSPLINTFDDQSRINQTQAYSPLTYDFSESDQRDTGLSQSDIIYLVESLKRKTAEVQSKDQAIRALKKENDRLKTLNDSNEREIHRLRALLEKDNISYPSYRKETSFHKIDQLKKQKNSFDQKPYQPPPKGKQSLDFFMQELDKEDENIPCFVSPLMLLGTQQQQSIKNSSPFRSPPGEIFEPIPTTFVFNPPKANQIQPPNKDFPEKQQPLKRSLIEDSKEFNFQDCSSLSESNQNSKLF